VHGSHEEDRVTPGAVMNAEDKVGQVLAPNDASQEPTSAGAAASGSGVATTAALVSSSTSGRKTYKVTLRLANLSAGVVELAREVGRLQQTVLVAALKQERVFTRLFTLEGVSGVAVKVGGVPPGSIKDADDDDDDGQPVSSADAVSSEKKELPSQNSPRSESESGARRATAIGPGDGSTTGSTILTPNPSPEPSPAPTTPAPAPASSPGDNPSETGAELVPLSPAASPDKAASAASSKTVANKDKATGDGGAMRSVKDESAASPDKAASDAGSKTLANKDKATGDGGAMRSVKDESAASPDKAASDAGVKTLGNKDKATGDGGAMRSVKDESAASPDKAASAASSKTLANKDTAPSDERTHKHNHVAGDSSGSTTRGGTKDSAEKSDEALASKGLPSSARKQPSGINSGNSKEVDQEESSSDQGAKPQRKLKNPQSHRGGEVEETSKKSALQKLAQELEHEASILDTAARSSGDRATAKAAHEAQGKADEVQNNLLQLYLRESQEENSQREFARSLQRTGDVSPERSSDSLMSLESSLKAMGFS